MLPDLKCLVTNSNTFFLLKGGDYVHLLLSTKLIHKSDPTSLKRPLRGIFEDIITLHDVIHNI